jgi:hypothetical protein
MWEVCEFVCIAVNFFFCFNFEISINKWEFINVNVFVNVLSGSAHAIYSYGRVLYGKNTSHSLVHKYENELFCAYTHWHTNWTFEKVEDIVIVIILLTSNLEK